MWYKLARDDYAKYALFDNFDEVAKKIYTILLDIDKINIGNFGQNIKARQKTIEFNNQNISLFSNKLQLKIPVKLDVDIKGIPNTSKFGAWYSFDDRTIFICVYLARKPTIGLIKNTLAHEIQHAVEHYYLKDSIYEPTSDANKRDKWIQDVKNKNPTYLDEKIKYINDPTEVRARTAEVLQAYNLPQNKVKMQEKIIQKGNTFQTYKQLIQDILTKTYKDVINLMSQEALNYIIKELYTAIWN